MVGTEHICEEQLIDILNEWTNEWMDGWMDVLHWSRKLAALKNIKPLFNQILLYADI